MTAGVKIDGAVDGATGDGVEEADDEAVDEQRMAVGRRLKRERVLISVTLNGYGGIINGYQFMF